MERAENEEEESYAENCSLGEIVEKMLDNVGNCEREHKSNEPLFWDWRRYQVNGILGKRECLDCKIAHGKKDEGGVMAM